MPCDVLIVPANQLEGNRFLVSHMGAILRPSPNQFRPREYLMFITPAYAQSAAGSGDFLIQILPFLLIFVIMYFLIIRPQQRRLKDHKEMVAALRRGDTVVTGGGLIGKVTKADDDELQVELAPGMKVKVIRSTITEVRSKNQPVSGKK